jgi:signal transduction histidine kinase
MIANNQNEIVKLSAHKMMRLIMNMLDVEKYTQTQLRLQPEDISLAQLLENLSLELEPSLSEKTSD